MANYSGIEKIAEQGVFPKIFSLGGILAIPSCTPLIES